MSLNAHRIYEVRRDPTYIYWRWKSGMIPGWEGKTDPRERPAKPTSAFPKFFRGEEEKTEAIILPDWSREDLVEHLHESCARCGLVLGIHEGEPPYRISGKCAGFAVKPPESSLVSPDEADLSAFKKEGAVTPWAPHRTQRPKGWIERLELATTAGLTRVLLAGPPGTGKTTAAAQGHKFSVTCHEAMGPETMIGMFILRAGQTEWVDGPATQAMRTGQRLILNEIDRTSGECTSLLYALMDDKPAIMLPTGEYVTAIDGYQVIGTTNASPNDIPEAIADRIEVVLLATEPAQGAVDVIGQTAPADVSRKITATLTNYYRSLRDSRGNWEWNGKATVRRMFAFAKLLNAGVEDSIAADMVFGKSGKEIISCMATAAK